MKVIALFGHAGTVSGVQSALQSLLQSLSYIPTLISPELSGFQWMMLASLGVVCVAAIFYTNSLINNKQHASRSFEEG